MTGTYTGQFVMNGFLDIRLSLWLRIAVTRLIAILPTLVVALAYRNSQGTELDVLNEWLNVLNSVQLPFALVPVSLQNRTLRTAAQVTSVHRVFFLVLLASAYARFVPSHVGHRFVYQLHKYLTSI